MTAVMTAPMLYSMGNGRWYTLEGVGVLGGLDVADVEAGGVGVGVGGQDALDVLGEGLGEGVGVREGMHVYIYVCI